MRRKIDLKLLNFSNAENSRFSYFVLFSIAVNVFFIWLPSYDHVNIAYWINSASYLQNSIPSFFGSSWPGGPFFMSLFVPIGLSYSFSGYSEIISVITLKTILFVFTFFTGMLVYSIISISNRRLGQKLFLFTLLNPGIIYVDYIWTNLDIFPVFFVALFYYFVYYMDKGNETFIDSLLISIPLLIAIFSFYYAVLIIPTIIIFSRNWKERVNFIVSFLVLGIPLYISEIFLFRGGEYDLVGSLVPPTTGLYYQGLQRIITIPSLYLIVSIGLLSLIIPIILKKYGSSPSVPILFILMITLYTSTNAAANNFLWLYPFSILAITENSDDNIKLRSIFITSSFFWTGILFINLYVGTGIQSGIFYFAYDIFHLNILLIHTNYQWIVSTLIYFVVLTCSFIGIIVYVLHYSLQNLYFRQRKPYGKQLGVISHNHNTITRKFRKTFFVVVFIIILIVATIPFNSLMPTLLNNSTVEHAPTEIFLTQYDNGVVAFPIENNTYSVNRNSINFFDNSNIIKMTRNLSKEFINTSVIETFNLNFQSKIELFNTSDFVIYASNSSFLNFSGYRTVTPNFTNAGKLSNLSIPSASTPIELNKFNKNTMVIYNSSYFSSSFYYTMLFKVQHAISPSSHFNQTVLFGLYDGSTSVDFVIYNNSGILSYNNNNNHTNIFNIYSNNSLDGWNILTLHSYKHGLDVGINGLGVFLKGSFFGNGSKLYVGEQGKNQSSHSFNGLVSELYSSRVNLVSSRIYTRIVSSRTNVTCLYNGDKLVINISDSHSGTVVNILRNHLLYSEPLRYLVTGKLDAIPYKLSIKFMELHIMPRDDKGFYLVPVFFAFAFPFIVATIGIIEIYFRRLDEGAGNH